MSGRERAEAYRRSAEDALRKAIEVTDPDQRSELIAMAAGWHTMAMEAERVSDTPQIVAQAKPAKSKPKHQY